MSDISNRLTYQIAVNAIVCKGTRRGVSPVFTPEELAELAEFYDDNQSPEEFAAEIEDRDNSIAGTI